MFQKLSRWAFPATPASTFDVTKTHEAIIEALVAYLYQIGHPVRGIRVPSFAVDANDYHYVTAYGDFRVVPGLDPYGQNVTTGKTASASVQANTVAASSDDDVVKVIDRAISETFEADDANFFTPTVPIFAKQGQTIMRIDCEYDRLAFARAVFSKLRAEGVVR